MFMWLLPVFLVNNNEDEENFLIFFGVTKTKTKVNTKDDSEIKVNGTVS